MNIKNKILGQKGGVTVLVFFTIFTFVIVLTTTFMSLSILRRSQTNSDIQIQKIYGQDYDNVNEVYDYLIENSNYTIYYNSNTKAEVTNMPRDQKVNINKRINISEKIPKYQGHVFLGWGENADDTIPKYNSGDLYQGKKSIQLYALWTDI